MRPNSPANRESIRHHAVIPRFTDAFRGLGLAYMEEPNLRFHVFAAATVLALALATNLDGLEALYLAGTVTLVITLELVNTAIERAVDLAAAGQVHPIAAMAKEVAAGAVLISACHAAGVGLYFFAWRLGPFETLSSLAARPFLLLLPAVALLGGFLGRERKRKE